MQWIIKYLTSSIGKKQIMGCTGAFLALFIFGHMCGNFQLLNFDQVSAQASYNAYTEFLTGFNPLHFPIKMIYLVELVLVAAFALHIFLAIKLKIENKKARGGIDYELNVRKGKKTFATFTMIWSGLFILGFLVQHLMMLKFGEHYLYMNDKGEIVRDMWLTTIQDLLGKLWVPLMACAVVAGGVLVVTTFGQDNTTPQYLGSPLNCLYGWLMCLAMMGWFRAKFDKTGAFAGYMTRSSFGLYIVHYLVVASLGYMMKTYTQLPPVAMYVILTVAVFTLSPLLCELLKRIPVVRWCVLGEK